MNSSTSAQNTSGVRIWSWQPLVVALALSVGWGIRGNFGHEIGAMLPGALAAMAAAILSGRSDWHRRVAFFGAAGAIGWSLGGSMSYMQVIAYTHSGHSPTVAYGYASLFVLGFLWAAPGGMAVALPAVLDRERLTGFFAPLMSIAVVWAATDFAVGLWDQVHVDFRQESPLYWYDTSWLEALGVVVAVTGLAIVRRRWDFASSLLLHASIGWWIAFLVLVPGLGLRMTPPRGDNWAGMVGIVGGLLVFFHRHRLPWVNQATLLTGLWGGVGFAGAAQFKLLGMATGLSTNWHSVLEQTYGWINGLGVAIALFQLARVAPRVTEEPHVRTWTEPWAAGLAVLGVTYLNARQNSGFWVNAKVIPDNLHGISLTVWHEAAWGLVGLAFLVLVLIHRRRPLAMIPNTWLGIGQLLFLALLWSMAMGNLLREITHFTPERLITEGVIHVHALICTVGILAIPTTASSAPIPAQRTGGSPRISRTSLAVVLTGLVCTGLFWGLTRFVYGDRPADGGWVHIRFGPRSNSTTAKPTPGQPHP
jgi:hypothetical protein